MVEIMNVDQVAAYLQLDKQTIYRKAKRGEIPAVRIGKTLRFKKDLLDSWLHLSSLQWSAKQRQSLRNWAEHFAKAKKLKQDQVVSAVRAHRKSKV